MSKKMPGTSTWPLLLSPALKTSALAATSCTMACRSMMVSMYPLPQAVSTWAQISWPSFATLSQV
ncbi:MAG: hypothetical protein QM767_19765 [Anaeromyxobacter sp.]